MDWMKIKTAGLPRWAWVSLFSGAVLLGLYLRTREPEETELEEEEEIDPEESGLGMYDGTETAGGLGSVGIAGPAGQQMVPVEAPFLPEGFVDLLTSQGAANVEAQQSIVELARDALAREPGERVETVVERAPVESNQGVTGGGAPKRKPHHKPPKKHQPKPKPPKGKGKGKGKPKGKARPPKKQKKPPRRGGHRNVGRKGRGHRVR